MMSQSFFPFFDDDAILFDVADFSIPGVGSSSSQINSPTLADTMGTSKRCASNTEEDSGFGCSQSFDCTQAAWGSNLSPPVAKLAKMDDEVMILRNLISEANGQQQQRDESTPLNVFASLSQANTIGTSHGRKRCASDIEEDSGFGYSQLTCGSNVSSPVVKLNDDVMLLKSLISEASGQALQQDDATTLFDDMETSFSLHAELKEKCSPKFSNNYSSMSRDGLYELKIVCQPEEQHRARYLTEGSRGSIKDKSGLGHPLVKLKRPARDCGLLKLQCFIGHDKQIGVPHLFYQASKISGKNSTRCTTTNVDGVAMVSVDLEPDHDMQVTIDCIGILKERNVDVEQKLLQLKNKSSSDEMPSLPNKKRSTKCRLVFRVELPGGEVLQSVSNPILCTQPLGTPEILKKSLSEGSMSGGQELFIIGKNFLKDSKMVWKSSNWTKIVEPDKEYLHSVSPT